MEEAMRKRNSRLKNGRRYGCTVVHNTFKGRSVGARGPKLEALGSAFEPIRVVQDQIVQALRDIH
jgi:hypothetical protein